MKRSVLIVGDAPMKFIGSEEDANSNDASVFLIWREGDDAPSLSLSGSSTWSYRAVRNCSTQLSQQGLTHPVPENAVTGIATGDMSHGMR